MEDTFLIADLSTGIRHELAAFDRTLESPGGVAFAALDAMGANCSGAEAGHISAEALRAHLSAAPLPESDAGCRDRLRAAMVAANRAIAEAIAQNPLRRGMGCAATLAVVRGDRLHVAHVGDSRAYVLRSGRLVQVTRDDTLLTQYLASGVSLAEAALVPRAVIVQALGMKESVTIAVSTVELRAGDVLRVCSDGLTTEVEDRTLESVLAAIADPAEACLALLNQALGAGGKDNITLLVARPEGDFLRPPGPADVLASPQPAMPT